MRDGTAPRPVAARAYEELNVVLPRGDDSDAVEVVEVPALLLPVRAALPVLTRARTDAHGHPAAVSWGAATVPALQFVARVLLLPGLSADDHDAWHVGPPALGAAPPGAGRPLVAVPGGAGQSGARRSGPPGSGNALVPLGAAAGQGPPEAGSRRSGASGKARSRRTGRQAVSGVSRSALEWVSWRCGARAERRAGSRTGWTAAEAFHRRGEST